MSKRPASSTQGRAKKAKTQQSLAGFFATKSSSDEAASSTTASSSASEYKLFCDLDGVLVDFDAGVKKLFNGRGPDEIPNQGMLWGAVGKADQFYARLPWTPDGKALWEAIKHLAPDILTGVPRSNKSRAEKLAWCKRELGVSVNHVDLAGKKSSHEVVTGRRKNKPGVVNVITCWSRNKHMECRAGNHILIDDRISLRDAWEERGGIFIHHTNTERTLSMLRERGVLDSKSNPDEEKKEEE